MILGNIKLSNFRLHESTSLEFSEGLNYITGGNGQGKTSLLEAIYYLCTTKSLNTTTDSEAVTFGKENFEVTGLFKGRVENRVRIFYDTANSKKHYFADGKQVHRASAVIGRFPVVSLTRTDAAITWGSPSERRKFVDSVISQASETYLKILIEYNRTLRHRSQLLTQIRESGDPSLMQQLEAWTDTLVKAGSEIVRHRERFVKEFNGYLSESYNFVMDRKEIPKITYEFLSSYGGETIEQRFYAALNELKRDEMRRTINLVGPHRDDFYFTVNDFELRKYGSQGQNKTFQIALRFGEFFYLKETLGTAPLFLMDDVFGELDAFRANRISGYLKEIGQAFITITDFSDFSHLDKSEGDKVIKVEQGNAVYA